VVDTLGFWLVDVNIGHPLVRIALYDAFISPTRMSTLVFVRMTNGLDQKAFEFISYMRGRIDGWMKASGVDPRDYLIGLTGYGAMLFDVQISSTEDMERMDIVALPIALLVLVFVLRALPLMIIPIVNVGITVVVSFALVYPIALYWEVATFVLAMMMSVIIAMSVDYSLFLLSRFREEVELGNTTYVAVGKTLRHSGKIVLTSGGVLTICVLGIAAFPVSVVSSMGVAAAVSLLTTMLVNLTFTPALLLCFGKFFSIFGLLPCVKRCRRVAVPEKERRSFWFRSATFSTTWPWVVGIGVVLLCAPICAMIVFFSWSMDNMQVIPRNSPAAITLDDLSGEFPEGKVCVCFFYFFLLLLKIFFLHPKKLSSPQRFIHTSYLP
jgi:uncharacterized membrane protein YdfJ with MMPL/SSD domain